MKVNSFVDVMAAVDDTCMSEEEEDREEVERDLREAFIDTNSDVGSMVVDLGVIHPKEDDSFDTYLSEVLKRARDEGERVNRSRATYTANDGPRLTLYPDQGDYPLWRVECRIGTEEFALAFLYGAATSGHGLRSAFMRGELRGYIYLECEMNILLVDLLKITPGIVFTRNGVQKSRINPDDYLKLLTMVDRQLSHFTPGAWVRVSKGLYKGDEGVVREVEEWGVTLLLVPRLDITRKTLTSNKRKAAVLRPEPRLLDDHRRESTEGLLIRTIAPNRYTIGDMKIEHGLTAKKFGFSSIERVAKDVSLTLFMEFRRSGHPLLHQWLIPRPREWCLEEGDMATDTLHGETGSIERVASTYIEVCMEHGELKQIPWTRVRKYISTGDPVTVWTGSHTGSAGWIVSTDGDVATIVVDQQTVDNSSRNQGLTHIEARINCLKNGKESTIPTTDKQEITQSNRNYSRVQHPWIGIEVIIAQPLHPRKGEPGQITNVLPSTSNHGVPRIELKLTGYDPNMPFSVITLDSDMVVSKIHRHPLHRINNQTSAAYRYDNISTLDAQFREPRRGETPVPTEYSESPAWNPIESTSATESNVTMDRNDPGSHSGTDKSYEHVLLNPILAGAVLKAFIKDGSSKAKEAIINIQHDTGTGTCCIRTVRYHTSMLVSKDDVTPKYPSPTHDNGLVLVIEGAHAGKYGRRLHHSRKDGKASMILQVVQVKEGERDALTGEILELDPEYMCVVEESKEQKKINIDIMKQSRQKYRGS